MRRIATSCAVLAVMLFVGPLAAAEPAWLALAGKPEADLREGAPAKDSWLGEDTLAKADLAAADADAKAPPKTEARGQSYTAPCKPPPLPLHTLEGLGGALTVPMAYLVNCGGGQPGLGGLPTASYTFISMPGKKTLQSLAVSQSFWSRLELSYSVNRFYIGNLQDVAGKISGGQFHPTDQIYLHNFNIRGVLIPENQFGSWTPQVTVGVHAKYNTAITRIDKELQGALSGLGLQRKYGFDYTLTLSKTFIVGGTPLIVSGTLRNSKASNMGLTGFAEDCQWTVEGCAAWVPVKWLAIAYEINQNNNPYHRAHGVVGKEANLRHGILVAWLVSDSLTIAGAWGRLGEIGNTQSDCVWGIQVKYEF